MHASFHSIRFVSSNPSQDHVRSFERKKKQIHYLPHPSQDDLFCAHLSQHPIRHRRPRLDHAGRRISICWVAGMDSQGVDPWESATDQSKTIDPWDSDGSMTSRQQKTRILKGMNSNILVLPRLDCATTIGSDQCLLGG